MSAVWIVSFVTLWIVVLIQVGLLLVLYRQLGEMYLGTAEGRSRDGISVGSRAPEFRLLDHNDQLVEVPSPHAKPMLLVFGLPTCGPCHSLMPHLAEFAAMYRHEIEVRYVAGPDAEANREFAHEYGASFPVLTQNGLDIARAYKVRQSPFAFYLDAEGVVQSKGIVNRLSQLARLVDQDGQMEMPIWVEPLSERA